MPIKERNKQTNSPNKLNLTKDELSNIKLKFGRVINERMSEVSSGKSQMFTQIENGGISGVIIQWSHIIVVVANPNVDLSSNVIQANTEQTIIDTLAPCLSNTEIINSIKILEKEVVLLQGTQQMNTEEETYYCLKQGSLLR